MQELVRQQCEKIALRLLRKGWINTQHIDLVINDLEGWEKDKIRLYKESMCRCDHLRSSHRDTVELGHGNCNINICNCIKFTWVRFI